MSEMSEWILRVRPTSEPLLCLTARLSAIWEIRVRVSKKEKNRGKTKAVDYTSRRRAALKITRVADVFDTKIAEMC